MKNKFGKLSVVLCLVVTLVLTLVPLFAFNASAEDETLDVTFSSISGSTQYKEETHQLNSDISLWIKDCHINTQLRIYSSTTNNGKAIFKLNDATKKFTSIKMNAGNKKDTIIIEGSNDEGATWTSIKEVAVTSTSYNDYTASFSEPYQWIRLDVKGTNQVRIAKATLTYATMSSEGDDTCDHANATVENVAATCTTKGYTRTTCECGYDETEYTADALGHDWNDGETTKDATCTTAGEKLYTCQRTECGETKKETIAALGHDFDANNICTECGYAKPQLTGEFYIAAKRSSGNYYYMVNTLVGSSTKRFSAVYSKVTTLPDSIIVDEAVANQVFVIEENNDGTYCIYAKNVATNNYIGWSSGNSAALVAKSNAKKFTIAETKNGCYEIYFMKGNEKRNLSLNNTSGNDYFAFYTGTQVNDLTLVPVVEKAPVKTEITGATVGLGENLSVYFFATLANAENLENYKMIFTINGRNVEAEAFELNGQYAFVLEGLAPQQMADRIDAKLYEGDEVVGGVEDYTIQKFAETVIADTTGTYTAAEKQLVVDMLYYGKAAQEYVDYYVDYEDSNNTIKAEGTATDATPKMEAAKPSGDGSEDAYISAAGVQFDFINRLYIKVKGDVTNVKVLINDVEVELTKSGDAWIAYTDAIAANQFATEYRFELYVNDVLAQELIYSVNAYAFAKWDAANPETQALARALYRYGVAAAAVKAN